MRKYEIMYILTADLSEEERKAEMENLHEIITTRGGEILNVDEWGVRPFAYPINDILKGYYVVVKVAADNEAIKEFERLSKINANVIRHLTVVEK
ncbi:MAG: 30S ribosomal protein S6 [Bacilli bacterium]|nr:30S ribosomal protein S6 [Bacilli bacterium]